MKILLVLKVNRSVKRILLSQKIEYIYIKISYYVFALLLYDFIRIWTRDTCFCYRLLAVLLDKLLWLLFHFALLLLLNIYQNGGIFTSTSPPWLWVCGTSSIPGFLVGIFSLRIPVLPTPGTLFLAPGAVLLLYITRDFTRPAMLNCTNIVPLIQKFRLMSTHIEVLGFIFWSHIQTSLLVPCCYHGC